MTNFCQLKTLAVAAALAALTLSSAHAATVLANNAAPGDAFSNAGSSNNGQAVGATGWYYNNVRNSGSVGISNANARSGNGSAAMSGSLGPAGNSSKADIEYLASATAFAGNFFATSSLGNFSALAGMSYDWYRNSSSSNSAGQHPSLRVLLDLDGNLATLGDRGGLVFEGVYNGQAVAPLDVWTSNAVTNSTKLWNFGLGLGNLFDLNNDGDAFNSSLADWQASGRLANAVIVGFSSGIGSGWGPFSGAVDNISWTIGNQSTTSNFEVQANPVPEPAGLALVAVGLLGLAVSRRQRR